MSKFALNKDMLEKIKSQLAKMAPPTLKPAYAMSGNCSANCTGDCWSCQGSCQGNCNDGCYHSCSGRGQ